MDSRALYHVPEPDSLLAFFSGVFGQHSTLVKLKVDGYIISRLVGGGVSSGFTWIYPFACF